MRKMLCALMAVLMLAIPISAKAATPRAASVVPNITYSENSATYSVRITGNSINDSIEAEIKFWRGTTCLATWEISQKGRVNFSNAVNVVSGYTYRLTVEWTLNGVVQDTVTISKKCP